MKIVIISLSILLILVHFLELNYKRRTLLVSDLKIGKKKFAILVLQWCIQNVANNNKPLYLKIIYRTPTKRLGYYEFSNNEITIHIDDSIYILELIDTIIHEYIHHLQIPNQKQQKEYIDKLTSIGYENHPMEIEARFLAKKYCGKCYDEIISKVI